MPAMDVLTPKHPDDKVVASQPRFVDHPLISWLLENGCILGMSTLRNSLPTARKLELRSLGAEVVAGLVLIEGSIFAQRVLADCVYAHIPYFTEAGRRRSSPPLREWLGDWVTCNLPSHMIAVTITSLALGGKKAAAMRHRRSHGVLGFLGILAISRVVADVVFYAVHRALHTRWLYRYVHKRHHEHKSTAIVTNFHFTVADLVIEGFLPLFGAMFVVERFFKVLPTPFEIGAIAGYLEWYEIGSHSGKAVPTVTYFPPLAPLYRWLFGNIDARNVLFHDLHHARLTCNYGITQWIDHLLGTAKLERDGASREGKLKVEDEHKAERSLKDER